jgi:hypothetical protein
MKCVLSFSTIFVWNSLPFDKDSARDHKFEYVFIKVLIELATNPQVSNFMKIRPMGAEMVHADGRI